MKTIEQITDEAMDAIAGATLMTDTVSDAAQIIRGAIFDAIEADRAQRVDDEGDLIPDTYYESGDRKFGYTGPWG